MLCIGAHRDDGEWSCHIKGYFHRAIHPSLLQYILIMRACFSSYISVNGVCFADESSTNILVSASDDGYLKVWDRRSLATETPAGVLAGHTEGITYVSPKGDGRYCISNGKDQTIRLWDLRKMLSPSDITRDPDAAAAYGLSGQGWDYKNSAYKKPRYNSHPKDNSIMQYRGHRVTKTLIRCHFSPTATTGGQYIYTGGSNGVIYVSCSDATWTSVLSVYPSNIG